MKLKRSVVLLASVGAILATSAGVFAATGLGDEDPKAAPGPPVHVKVERSTWSAAPAGAKAIAAKTKPLKKVGYFSATQAVSVPAGGLTQIAILKCPKKGLVVSGGYETDRAVVADVFSPAGKRQWQFGFADIAGAPGAAVPWIVCVK